jgi:hypothetical protein
VVVVEGVGTAVMLTPNWPAFSWELTAEELLPIRTCTFQMASVAVKELPVSVTVVEVEPDDWGTVTVVGFDSCTSVTEYPASRNLVW